MKVIHLGNLIVRLEDDGKVTLDTQGGEWEGTLEELLATLALRAETVEKAA